MVTGAMMAAVAPWAAAVVVKLALALGDVEPLRINPLLGEPRVEGAVPV